MNELSWPDPWPISALKRFEPELALPRSFDSDNRSSDLVFTENVMCPNCCTIFEGEFADQAQSLSVQDMTEAPEGDHQCPSCSLRFSTAMTGWLFYGEAG